ncbi:MAG: hypothetical protein KIS62_01375 [Ramlibacter sp.]|nr:hypothetical protein [Ramlibacter sp.]
MKQLTQAEAIALAESCAWEAWTCQQRAIFQIIQDRLCMPFEVFHEAVEKTLGRPVFTHEFGLSRERLTQELAGVNGAPSMEEIIALLPTPTVVVVLDPTSDFGDAS